jgi:uncharacterized protein (DUF58 family)
VSRLRLPSRSAARGVTSAGWGLIVVTAVAYVVGVVFVWREALIVAAGSLILLVVSLLWLFGRLGLDIERPTMRRHAEVGTRLIAELTVRNPNRRPLGPRTAEDRMGDHRVPLRFPALAGHATHVERYVVPTEQRGVYQLGPVRIVRADPFGFFRRERLVGDVHTLYVTPRVHLLEQSGRSWRHDIDGPTFDMSPQGTVFHALREYVRGDDHRHIHWRSSARTGTLMVRQYVDTRRPSTLVVFDNREVEYDTARLFELAVEVVASVSMAAVEAGRPVTLFALDTPLGTPPPGAGTDLLERLCTIVPSANPTLDDLMHQVRLADLDVTETVLVTGRGGEGFLPALQWLPGAAPVVVRAQHGEAPLVLPRGDVIDASTGEEFVVQWNALARG